MSLRRTLLVGGAGFIGRYLASALINTGRLVTVIGRSKLENLDIEGVNYVVGDFGDLDTISELLDKHDEVVHLAYATVPNTSYENPLLDLTDNLPATVQLFSLVAEKQLKLLLVSSGGTVYGESEYLPIDEQHPTKPISPYGVTKLTLENYARLYAVTKGLKFICVRPSNAYGIGQMPFKGQGFISTAIASILNGKQITIYGISGTVRDYIYVSDLAEGICAALDRGLVGETYNIGSGKGLSNLELILKIKSELKYKDHEINIKYLPAREFDVKTNILDSSKLIRETNWKPSVTIQEGLAKTIEWLSESNHNYGK